MASAVSANKTFRSFKDKIPLIFEKAADTCHLNVTDLPSSFFENDPKQLVKRTLYENCYAPLYEYCRMRFEGEDITKFVEEADLDSETDNLLLINANYFIHKYFVPASGTKAFCRLIYIFAFEIFESMVEKRRDEYNDFVSKASTDDEKIRAVRFLNELPTPYQFQEIGKLY
jgi:hypothetical protein